MQEPNVYLCQFRDVGRDYFKTDCAFCEDQLEQAVDYVNKVVIVLADVAEGKVYNAKLKCEVHRLAKPEVE